MLGGDGLWVGLRTDIEFLSNLMWCSNTLLASGMLPTPVSVPFSILEFTVSDPN